MRKDMENSPEHTSGTAQTEAGTEAEAPRSYTAYRSGEFSFDPLKDLNLPGSYAEVVARFERLQGVKAAEILN